MQILALDTCDPEGSLALLRDRAHLRLESHPVSEEYSSWLVPAVRRLLSVEGLDLRAIDVFAVAGGPGSFTGLRVGLTTVKAWAEIYHRPIAAVSRLEALAEENSGTAPYVASFFDGRRNQVFGALFRRESGLQRVEDEAVIAPDQFLEWCTRRTGNDAIDWISPQPACATALAGWRPRADRGECVQEFTGPLAPVIGQIGFRLAQAGQLTDALRLDANYIRRSDAEIFWKGASHGS